jgi:beta-amylase
MRLRIVCAAALLFGALYVQAKIPVYVLLQLDAVTSSRTVNNPSQLQSQMQQLKNAGVTGVSADFWWGLVERDAPKSYYWTPYTQILDICRSVGLKMVPVLSFHQCGGNVGDACDIPIPSWASSVANSYDIFYKDAEGYSTNEYLSLGVDNQKIFGGRSAVDMYSDYMSDFNQNVLSKYSDVIDQVHLSLGPASELRYPSYPLSKWSFCGVGEFICYDKYMLQNLADSATAIGHPEWGHAGPNNAGNYNSQPQDTGFFSTSGGDNFQSGYGQFFLNWYSEQLITHGETIVQSANSIFSGTGISIAAKVSGVHWWYNTNHHAAELTAGYNVVNGNNFYSKVAQRLKNAGLDILVFTCMEMRDSQQPSNCDCGPYELVKQVKAAAGSAGLKFAGENALPRYDSDAYSVILDQSTNSFPNVEFTYLRLGSDLLSSSNFGTFQNFVNNMNNVQTA